MAEMMEMQLKSRCRWRCNLNLDGGILFPIMIKRLVVIVMAVCIATPVTQTSTSGQEFTQKTIATEYSTETSSPVSFYDQQPSKRRKIDDSDSTSTLASFTIEPTLLDSSITSKTLEIVQPTTSLLLENVPVIEYQLARNLTTVAQLWQEYKYGINGNPSVASIVAHNPEWLSKQQSYYFGRKSIHNFILKGIKIGKNSELQVVLSLEHFRNSRNWSLNQLRLNIPWMDWNNATNEIEYSELVYRQYRKLNTVMQVWQEYKHGLNGNPSVESLVKDFRIQWLKSSGDQGHYYGRKKIYDFVNSAAIGSEKSEDQVVEMLENTRLAQNWTLKDLQKNISRLRVLENGIGVGDLVTEYQLSRNLTTVAQCWQEYKYGINGNPNISGLITLSGEILRFKFNTDQLLYNQRKLIWEFVKNASKSRPEEKVVQELESFRKGRRWTLSTLGFNIASLFWDKDGSLQQDKKVTGYRMARNLTTVAQLWEEYKYGLNGNPSISSLMDEYGTKWLLGKGDKAYYYARKPLYDFIQSAQRNGTSESETILKLETIRIENQWKLVDLQRIVPVIIDNPESGKLEFEKPIYRLARNLTTVPQVWNEYKYGIDGHPSVESIVQKHAQNWLHFKGDGAFYRARKKIYDYIENEMNNKTEEEAVRLLEEKRVANGWSLSMLQTELAKIKT